MKRAVFRVLTNQQQKKFIAEHRLPDKFRDLIDGHYSPLAKWVIQQHRPRKTLFLGINGAQGTGKSTLAAFLQFALESNTGWCVAVLSIDDFYLTKAERKALGKRIHPLLATRGVPGTHDMQMLAACIERLRNLNAETILSLPRFDKARDDRASPDSWPVISGPVDLIILEGWCIGSKPQQGDGARPTPAGVSYTLTPPSPPIISNRSGKWPRSMRHASAGRGTP